MNLKLVEDWRDARKWISTKCMALAGAVQAAWLYIPADMKASVPPSLVGAVTIGLLALGVAGRVIQQAPAAPTADAAAAEDAPK